jgi:hypothetical protein
MTRFRRGLYTWSHVLSCRKDQGKHLGKYIGIAARRHSGITLETPGALSIQTQMVLAAGRTAGESEEA